MHPDRSPPTLDYATPHAPAPGSSQTWRIFLCTALFAATHLIVEYQAQLAYHLRNSPPPGTWAYTKATDGIEFDMMTETMEVAVAAFFVLVFQLMFSRPTPRPRYLDWAIAIALGIIFCALRWASSFYFSQPTQSFLEPVEILLLGSISGIVLAKCRQAR